MAVITPSIDTSTGLVRFCNGGQHGDIVVYINVTKTGNSTTYWKTDKLSLGGCESQILPEGNFSYGIYNASTNERVGRGDFVVSSGGSGGGGGEEEEEPAKYSCLTVQGVSAIINSYNSTDGTASITVNAILRNPNYIDDYFGYDYVRGRATIAVVDSNDSSFSRNTSNVNFYSRNEDIEVSVTWSNYWIGSVNNFYFTSITITPTHYYYSDCQEDGCSMHNNCGGKLYSNITPSYSPVYSAWTWADGSSGVNAIVSGKSNFTDKITASTWLTIIAAVNKLTGSNISTSGVQSGQNFTATHYNNVAKALGLSTVSSGQDCDADLFNDIWYEYHRQAGLL